MKFRQKEGKKPTTRGPDAPAGPALDARLPLQPAVGAELLSGTPTVQRVPPKSRRSGLHAQVTTTFAQPFAAANDNS